MCEHINGSFWNFISKHTIEIPIIQRDYAQGRKGQEDLRKSLLTDLKEALDNKSPLKFDFVYGEEKDNKVFPLDGQQRLTTLWLLHWYIALRAGKLAEAADVLKKFTYETRVSSREFCHALCDDKKFSSFEDEDIVEFIQNQTWFYSFWRQDPTIQGMLTTLKGTGKQDGITEVFKEDNFSEYWQVLTNNDCKICFDYLPLKDFNLSDDLYIKMNARGKQLTPFENFKAELVGYIESPKSTDDEWKIGFASKLDNDWTDIFWSKKSSEYDIDEIYYAFCNRFFLNALICHKKNGVDYTKTAEELEKSTTFERLYDNQGGDSKIEFSSLEYYRFCEGTTPIPLVVLQSFEKVLDNYKNEMENLKDFFPEWVTNDFHFIPEYKESSITTLTQPERVVFFAICRYLEQDQAFNTDSFSQWMRVVWNIVENSDINSIQSMIGAMRLIDELSTHTHDIYNYLADDTVSRKSTFAKEQLEEERIKAILINDEDWKSIIDEAEKKLKYFTGQLRFALSYAGLNNILEKKKASQDAKEKFENCIKNLSPLFGDKGLSDEAKKDARLQRALLSISQGEYLTKDNKNECFIVDERNNRQNWKDYLKSDDKSSYFSQLFEDKLYNPDDLTCLEEIAKEYKQNAEPWVQCFIDYPQLLADDASELKIGPKKLIRRDNGTVYILEGERMSSRHSEIFTAIKYLEYKKNKLFDTPKPFESLEYWRSSNNELPCLYFDQWKYQENNFALDCYFESKQEPQSNQSLNSFKLIFWDRGKKEVPTNIKQILINNGFKPENAPTKNGYVQSVSREQLQEKLEEILEALKPPSNCS